MSNKNWTRRRFLVDPAFQLDVALRTSIYAIVLLLVLSIGIFYPMAQDLQGDDASAVDAAASLLYLHQHYWPIVVVCLIVNLLLSIRISHRIAGPLVRVKRRLQQLAQGVIPAPLQTRSRDYLKQEVLLLNLAHESLNTRLGEVQAAEATLRDAMLACSEQIDATADAALQQTFAKALAAAETLHAKSSYFQLSTSAAPEAAEPRGKPTPELAPY